MRIANGDIEGEIIVQSQSHSVRVSKTSLTSETSGDGVDGSVGMAATGSAAANSSGARCKLKVDGSAMKSMKRLAKSVKLQEMNIKMEGE